MRTPAGFTLIEMLITLLVFALAAVVVQGNLAHIGRDLSALEERTFASWIAQNHVTDLQLALKLGESPRHARQRLELQYAGQSWQVNTELIESNAQRLRRLDIEVCLEESLEDDRCHVPFSRYILME